MALEENKKIPVIRFDPAYSGGFLHMDPANWPLPTVFDIDGLEERPQEVPIVRDHDQNKKVGQTTRINYDDGRIVAEGRVINYGIDDDAAKIVELAKRGAKLQASVATALIKNEDVERVEPGQTATANGQTFQGPCEIVRKWRLKEISVVTLGADDEGTRVIIGEASAAPFIAPRAQKKHGGNMGYKFRWDKFFRGMGVNRGAARKAAAKIAQAAKASEPTAEDVLKALEEELKDQGAAAKKDKAQDGTDDDEKKFEALCAFAADIGAADPEEMTDEELAVLEAAFAKFAKAQDEEPEDEEKLAALAAFAADIGAADPEEMTDEELAVLEAAFAKFAKAQDGGEEEEKKDEKPAAASIGRFTPRSGAAAFSRTKYPAGLLGSQTTTVFSGNSRPSAARVAEASLFVSNGTNGETLERLGYTQDEINEAQRKENRTLSLTGLFYRSGAARAGYCDAGTINDALQHAQYLAQREKHEGYRVARAEGQLSTVDIPNVLANVINKSLLNGTQSIDDPTDRISRVVPAKDFRPQYFIDLLAAGEFAEVKANGELENLKLSDDRYENAAKMRGFEIRIGYETIANDDMNAIQEIPRIMGRKAALRKQKEFWRVFTSAAVASSPNNLPSVTGNPVLNLTGLDKAEAAFAGLKDDDSDPIGARPRFLIVPPALKQTAINLTAASQIAAGAGGDNVGITFVPNTKRYAELLDVVYSEYLGANGPFATNWGDKKWALLADPQDVPLMIMSYYQNQKAPSIETVYGQTKVEGLRYVCTWGFGVSVAVKKSCVISTGAAS